MSEIYILGGEQTDFARNWAREGKGLYEMFCEVLDEALQATGLEPGQIEVCHVGNFVGDLFAGQGLLNGFLAEAHPELSGVPGSRHEAACASGSIAVLSAMRDLEAGHYELACVLGLELMRNVDGRTGAEHLAVATFRGREATQCSFPWPYMFNRIIDEYERRHGIDCDQLTDISRINFENARANPAAQTRHWELSPDCFSADSRANPVIEGRIRKMDCGQITDGAVCVFLASEKAARDYAAARGLRLADLPRIKGWGHRSAPLSLDSKLALSAGQPLLFPHVAQLMQDALRRADMQAVTDLDGLETHDCFSITQYMAIDHIGLTPPGQSGRAVAEGWIRRDGRFPINPSGGLIGLGHPVGATGVRMLWDCARQVTAQAGDCQVAGARNMATFNLGGSTTTCVSFIVGVGA